MYESHFHLKVKPFTLLPEPEFLYLGPKHRMALSLLEYGLANGSAFMVIAGEPGTGKTTLLNRLLDQTRHPWTVGILSNTHAGFGGLLPWIAASFNLTTKDKNEADVFQELSRFLERERSASRRVLLVIDEAQNIGATMLEELRLLSNLNDGRSRSLQILLSGQLGLRDLLKEPGMVQFAQRIGVEYTLDALSEDETIAYIAHRLEIAGRRTPLFTTLASHCVFRLTSGTPRLINQLCDHALVYGFAIQAKTITARITLDAAAARACHGMFPFAVSPECVVTSPSEEEKEQDQVRTFQIQRDASNGSTVRRSAAAETQDPAVVYQQAIALKDSGKFEKAMVLFDRLIEQKLWAVKAFAQKGLCLKAMGQYEEAICSIQAGISQPSASAGNRTALQYMLGRTFEAMGKSAEAVETYRELQREAGAYRDVEARLGSLNGFRRNGRSTGDASSSWLGSLLKGYTQMVRGTRVRER